ncbi:MAG: ribonucleotide-diphosphate reductase subunit alpha, partial [Thermoplasmata archaeon]|nr:ribonucleotide-diphosphate reductase subunit alpha [Thermoplasmata archaeon]
MRVVKRDGRIVEFDKEKIFHAVRKAMDSIGGYSEIDARIVTNEVVSRIRAMKKEEIGVEDIQDIVEEVLMLQGYVKVAKAYILYREERKKLRETKKILGVHDDLKLTVNAVKVLEARYLLKDEKGNIIETPRQMFERTARYLAIVEIFYEDDIYDPEGRQEKKEPEDVEKPEFLSVWEFKMLKRAYKYFGEEGHMKRSFGYVLKALQERWNKIEMVKNEFMDVMISRKYIPNSPTLMNANTKLGQLSACFVLPVADSIEGIFDAVKYA